ncbi:class I SAM-dependent methyltransferase [Methanosarcina sp. 2.H.A.1B.4]|uniref:class I SAM-dependent methyltransferase n=1 Tax=Methanosarcina sp. 2.H.A.1B.4 TaxID=1483600 RepID=UPI0006228E1B|nr:class I SAM-dependent methyltransferase [Methanosarcina sp. 2.H.A.1B.4]KKG09230.1 SAM-dependent methlyltransferase [Methanosarcina sp. 2.H.A.1B.4]
MSKSYWEMVPGKNIPSSLELYPVVYSYLQEGYNILDVGCGFGKISIELASLGYSVTGIDINTEAVKLSKAAAKNLGLDRKIEGRAEFKVVDASDLPFHESSFDFAVMQAFLTSVPDPQERARIIQEAFRVLKPGGYLYLVEFGQNWHLKLYRNRYLQDFPVTKEEGSFLALNPETGEVEYIAHHFSEKELVFLLVDCGFEIDYFRVEELKTRTGNKINGFVVVAKKL